MANVRATKIRIACIRITNHVVTAAEEAASGGGAGALCVGGGDGVGRPHRDGAVGEAKVGQALLLHRV